MDALLNQRWIDGLSPFNGDCFHTVDLISIDELMSLLAVILPPLVQDHGTQTLYTFADWHQHDGIVTERQVIEWSSLAILSQNVKALLASGYGDTYVHRSYYSEDLTFLLRYDFPDEESGDGRGFSGRLDLSANSTMIVQTISLLPATLRSRLIVEQSKAYFDRTYSG